MGNEQAKTKKKFVPKNIDKNKLDILVKQIYFTAQLNRDRRKGQQNARERELLSLFREAPNRRNKDNEYQKASAIVNDIKWIKAYECIMRYAEVLKDNKTVIEMSKGDATKINELIPYVESIIWGCQKCNLDCIKPFQDFICVSFGLEAHNELCKFTQVTPEIKSFFNSILPSEKEVKSYLLDFCDKNGISLETMNEIGHNISQSAIDDMADPHLTNQHPNNPSQKKADSEIQAPISFNQMNYQQSGYSATYPAPYNNILGPYPQTNYAQLPTNYQFGGYPQNDFAQGGFPQGIHPQPIYPQTNFPSNAQNLGGFSQGQNFHEQNYPPKDIYPQFENYSSASQQQSLPQDFNKQFPGQSNQGPSQGLAQNGYPNFQIFGNAHGGKSGGDPLDELDLRLKNIKEGL